MIVARNLSLHYSTPHGLAAVLSDISCEIADGEFAALMGANGSGKTSFARCLNGIIQPSSGAVLVDGMNTRDHESLREIRRRVGMVFQHPDNQMVAPTVEREIAFGLENLGVPRKEMRERVEAMLARFELQAYREHAPHQLSGGEKQRVALASILAMQPRHLIFDEPTSLLDHPSRVRLFETIAELRREMPPAILLITQFAEEALFAERLLVLDHGRLVMDGAPRELFMNLEAFARIGLQAPLEFRVFHELRKRGVMALALEELLLDPIL
jgi:energy-coupling factor transporter ATPase